MYKDLSLKEKAKVIREGVRLGINSIDDILNLYDEAISIPEDPPVILKVNKSLADFVLRLKDPNRTYIRDWENPEYIATHKLSWTEDDKGAVIYPLVQNVNGKLVDFSRPPYDIWAGYENAIKTGDTIRMSPQEAEWFTTHYKDYYPSFDKYSKGGNIILDNNGYYAHSKYNKDGTTNDMLIKGDGTGTSITTQGIPFKIAAWDNLGNYQELEPNGEYYFPRSMVRQHALQTGGLAKPFSYGDIPDVRYLKGGNIFLNGELINRIRPIEEYITPIEPSVLDNTYVVRNYPYCLLPEVLDRNKRLSDEELSDYYASNILWTMENPKHKGLNSDGTYSAYEDEAGFNFGPGLHAKSNNLDINKTYTKLELDSIASNIALNYMKLISDDLETMQDGRYAGARDTLSAGPLLTMLDIAYNVKPKNKGNMPQKWPNLTDSLINGNLEKAKENTYSGSTRRLNMRNLMIVYKPLEGITVHNEALGGNLFKKGGIYINPKNKGKFTETMRRTDKSKYELAHSKNPLTRKRALFAINASHWKYLEGGYSDRLNNLNWKMRHSAGSGNIGSVWYNYTFNPENSYYNGTHYVGLNLLGKTQEQLPQGRDHVNLYTYGDETGFERINNATPITVNGETYDYRLYYGNILPFDTIYLKPESLPVVDSMIKHKDLLGVNTDYFIMDLDDAEKYPKQYKNVFSNKNIKRNMPLDDTRAVSISPKRDENGYYLDAFDVIDYKKTRGFAGNKLDKIVLKENILNGPYILRQRIPVVFDKNKESNGTLLNLISQYKDNGMTWEEYLMKYSPSYNIIYGRHNQDAVNIEHKRKYGGHLYSEGGFLLAPYLYNE